MLFDCQLDGTMEILACGSFFGFCAVFGSAKQLLSVWIVQGGFQFLNVVL